MDKGGQGMDKEADKKVAEIKERLARGDYAVDPSAVADAILRRSRDMRLGRAEMRAHGSARGSGQTSCSYPRSSSEESRKTTLGVSAVLARPIQVIRALWGRLARALSIRPRALGGAQTQSS